MLLHPIGWRTLEVRMGSYETPPLERAWLHVIEGETQVMAQVIRTGELVSLRKDTTEAEALPAVLEDELRILYETLGLERAAVARHRP
jgi:hypothetical protein